jgi:hypothetical protein
MKLPLLLSLIVVLALPTRGWAQGASPEAASPDFALLRHQEDYRHLARLDRPRSAWERLKYVPLAPPGTDAFLSIGGDARLRVTDFDDENWGLGPSEDGFLLQRYALHADIHAGHRVRLFAQPVVAFAQDRAGGAGPTEEDRLAVQQAFVDVVLLSRKGPTGWQVILRPGRQEFVLGSHRLLDVREGQNVRRSFEAVRLFTAGVATQIDAFLARPLVPAPGAFDNAGSTEETFWGVYGTRHWPKREQPLVPTTLDVYYLGFRHQDAAFDAAVGDERRHTFGLRLAEDAPPFTYDVEAAVQVGSFDDPRPPTQQPSAQIGSNRDIRAWTVAVQTTYRFDALPLTPSLTFKTNVASGDAHASDDRLQTFNPLYPNGGYFGGFGLAAANQMTVHPGVALRPLSAVTVGADVALFWRHRTADGIYLFPRRPLLPGRESADRFVGVQPTVSVAWEASPFVSVSAQYAWFPAGPYLEEAGSSDGLRFAEFGAALRF